MTLRWANHLSSRNGVSKVAAPGGRGHDRVRVKMSLIGVLQRSCLYSSAFVGVLLIASTNAAP